MSIKNIIVLLALFSLLGFPTKDSAAELEIGMSQNIKVYAFERVLYRWGDEQWVYFNDLIKRESNWSNTEQNDRSTAYGLGQFLNSTWDIVGCTKTSNSYKQIDCTIKYIEKVYGTPKKAIVFHNIHHWY